MRNKNSSPNHSSEMEPNSSLTGDLLILTFREEKACDSRQEAFLFFDLCRLGRTTLGSSTLDRFLQGTLRGLRVAL